MLLKTIRLILPALFPSWRFFEDVAASPRLDARTLSGGVWSGWKEVAPVPDTLRPVQGLQRLFWNPASNERLFHVSMCERLLNTQSPYAKAHLNQLANKTVAPETSYQFRIRTLCREGSVIAPLTEYQSPIYAS